MLKNTKTSPYVQKRLMDMFILCVMIYAAESWALSESQLESVAIAQRKGGRQMLDVTLYDHIASTMF